MRYRVDITVKEPVGDHIVSLLEEVADALWTRKLKPTDPAKITTNRGSVIVIPDPAE